MPPLGNEARQCISRCLECHDVCLETLAAASEGGAGVPGELVAALLECSQLCELSRDLMLRSSPLHADACRACVVAAERCVEACEAVGGRSLQRCGDVCRRCAESCRAMALAS